LRTLLLGIHSPTLTPALILTLILSLTFILTLILTPILTLTGLPIQARRFIEDTTTWDSLRALGVPVDSYGMIYQVRVIVIVRVRVRVRVGIHYGL
jgi:hypothetical protein